MPQPLGFLHSKPLRFFLSGALFTYLGPFLFYHLYYIGPILALLIVELLVHILRFSLYKSFVFSGGNFAVTPSRYIQAILPVLLANLLVVSSLAPYTSRLTVILVSLSISTFLGYLSSSASFKKHL